MKVRINQLKEGKTGWYKAAVVDTEEREVMEDNTDNQYIEDMLNETFGDDWSSITEKYDNHYINAVRISDKNID